MEDRYRWNILGLSYICMLAFTFVFQSIPPILTLIITEFHLSHAQAGLLMSLFALPGILSFLAGLFSDFYGIKKVGLFCLILMIVGTLVVASGKTFFFISFGRILSGIGALTLVVIIPQLLSQWFMGKELGVAMGIFSTAFPLGTIICFNTIGRVGEDLGWRTSIFITAAISVGALMAFHLLYRSSPLERRESTKTMTGLFSGLLKAGIPIWILGFTWMWYNAAIISFFTFALGFFISRGFNIGFAGFLASLLMWCSLVSSPAIGYLIDKIGGKEILIGVGGVISALILFLIPNVGTPFVFLLIILGVGQSFVPAPVFSLIPDLLKPQNLGLGYGILNSCLNIGVVLGPYSVGLLIDKTSSYQMGFGLMSIFALLATLTIIILHVKKGRKI